MRILIACLALVAAIAPAASAQDDAEHLNAELQELRADNAKLAAEVDALRRENAQLRKQLGQAADANRTLAEKTEAMQEKVVELTAEKQTLAQEIEVEQQRTRQRFTASTYRPDTDTTTVATRFTPLKTNSKVIGDHWIAADFDHPGKAVAAPVSAATIRVTTSFTAGDYRKARTAVITVDGEPVSCRVSNYESRSRNIGGIRNRRRVADESFDIAVTRELLERIAAARSVTIGFGRASAPLSTEQVAALSALAKAMRGG